MHPGAVGLLLYSDPHDDGFALGMVYPDGPSRPAESAQRGSVREGAVTQSLAFAPCGHTKTNANTQLACFLVLLQVRVTP
jgi:hypothetical protein